MLYVVCHRVCGLGAVVLILLGVGDESVSLKCLVCLLWPYGVVLDVGCGSWAVWGGGGCWFWIMGVKAWGGGASGEVLAAPLLLYLSLFQPKF